MACLESSLLKTGGMLQIGPTARSVEPVRAQTDPEDSRRVWADDHRRWTAAIATWLANWDPAERDWLRQAQRGSAKNFRQNGGKKCVI